MKSFTAILLAFGLASAAPAQLEHRQVPATPPAGSKESFEQAASIIGGLAKALQSPGGAQAIPLGPQSGSILGSIAQGLADAGKSAKPASALAARQVATPPAGSKESFDQASGIIGQIAKGLQAPGGAQAIPFGPQSGAILQDLAKGISDAGKNAKPARALTVRQVTSPGYQPPAPYVYTPPAPPAQVGPPPGSKESFEQAASIIGSLAKGLQTPGAKGIPFGPESGGFLSSIAAGLAEAGKSAKPAGKMAVQQAA